MKEYDDILKEERRQGDTITKYFICDRHRRNIDAEYMFSFMLHKSKPFHYFDTKEEAEEAMRKGFYDDSDYSVISVVLTDTRFD